MICIIPKNKLHLKYGKNENSNGSKVNIKYYYYI
jgi:hypothetical protein